MGGKKQPWGENPKITAMGAGLWSQEKPRGGGRGWGGVELQRGPTGWEMDMIPKSIDDLPSSGADKGF